MRRLLLILLMVLTPLQISWAATFTLDDHPVQGHHQHHADSDSGFHLHDADDHHDGHCQPVFSVLLDALGPTAATPPRSAEPAALHIAFTSHIPLPEQRPPL